MNSNPQTISCSVSSFQTQTIQNEKKNTFLYSSSAPYALKKRLIAPKWWVESLLLTLGKKHTWHASLMNAHENQHVYECFKVTSKNVFFMFLLWHELAQQMFALQNTKTSKIRIEISQYLFGTDEENHAMLEKLEETLITPIKIFSVQKSNSEDVCTLAKSGFINIFRKISVDCDDTGIWLTAYLAQKLSSLFVFPDTKSRETPSHTDYFTLNPNLFYAMGSKVNLKKVLDTLFLEYSKQNQLTSSSEQIDNSELLSATSVKLFSEPPGDELHKVRNALHHTDACAIKRIRKAEAMLERKNLKLNAQPEIQTLETNVAILPTFSQKPIIEDSRSNIEEQKINLDSKISMKIEHIQSEESVQSTTYEQITTSQQITTSTQSKTLEQSTVSEDSDSTQTSESAPQLPNFHKSTEREFRIFVTRFYESLNPRQKKIFEREQQGMTGQQFRSFMIPILRRNLSTIMTSC